MRTPQVNTLPSDKPFSSTEPNRYFAYSDSFASLMMASRGKRLGQRCRQRPHELHRSLQECFFRLFYPHISVNVVIRKARSQVDGLRTRSAIAACGAPRAFSADQGGDLCPDFLPVGRMRRGRVQNPFCVFYLGDRRKPDENPEMGIG